jgi:hypothetical protein
LDKIIDSPFVYFAYFVVKLRLLSFAGFSLICFRFPLDSPAFAGLRPADAFLAAFYGRFLDSAGVKSIYVFGYFLSVCKFA